jgi:hypothetical protein
MFVRRCYKFLIPIWSGWGKATVILVKARNEGGTRAIVGWIPACEFVNLSVGTHSSGRFCACIWDWTGPKSDFFTNSCAGMTGAPLGPRESGIDTAFLKP